MFFDEKHQNNTSLFITRLSFEVGKQVFWLSLWMENSGKWKKH